MKTHRIQTIVIGGGQAGLAAGYHLSRLGRDFVILDGGERLGDSWRNRWDSLRLFTRARFAGLPGMPFPGPPRYYPSKDKMADYLEAYAQHFRLPVELGRRVEHMVRRSTPRSTGAPERSKDRCWSSARATRAPRSPWIARHGHETWLSGRHPGQIPERARGRLYWWLMRERPTAETKPGRKLRAKAYSEGAPLLRLTSGRLKKAGIECVTGVAETRHGMPVLGDRRSVAPGSIVWATGYRHSYAWTGAETDEHGVPLHERGVVRGEPGMYMLGLRSSTRSRPPLRAAWDATPSTSPARSRRGQRSKARASTASSTPAGPREASVARRSAPVALRRSSSFSIAATIFRAQGRPARSTCAPASAREVVGADEVEIERGRERVGLLLEGLAAHAVGLAPHAVLGALELAIEELRFAIGDRLLPAVPAFAAAQQDPPALRVVWPPLHGVDEIGAAGGAIRERCTAGTKHALEHRASESQTSLPHRREKSKHCFLNACGVCGQVSRRVGPDGWSKTGHRRRSAT
ncbi:MAG: NAD(P)-binding domain-containing protein [Thermoleophilaceae bacterium]